MGAGQSCRDRGDKPSFTSMTSQLTTPGGWSQKETEIQQHHGSGACGAL